MKKLNMYTDKQKNKFSLLRAEGDSFYSVGNKLIDEYKPVKRIPVNLIKLHSFCIFLECHFLLCHCFINSENVIYEISVTFFDII